MPKDAWKAIVAAFEAREGQPMVIRDGDVASLLVNAKHSLQGRSYTWKSILKPIRIEVSPEPMRRLAEILVSKAAPRTYVLEAEDETLWAEGGILEPAERLDDPVEDLGAFLLRHSSIADEDIVRRAVLGYDRPRTIERFAIEERHPSPRQEPGQFLDEADTKAEIQDWLRERFRMDADGKIRSRLQGGLVPTWKLWVERTGHVRLAIDDGNLSGTHKAYASASFGLGDTRKAIDVATAVAKRLGTTADVRSACVLHGEWKHPSPGFTENAASIARELFSRGAAIKPTLSADAASAMERLRDATAANRKGFAFSLPKAWADFVNEFRKMPPDASPTYQRLNAQVAVMEALAEAVPKIRTRPEPFPVSMGERILGDVPKSKQAGTAYLAIRQEAVDAIAAYRSTQDDDTETRLVKAFEALSEAVPHDFANRHEADRWGSVVRSRLRRLVELARGGAPDHELRHAGP